jgi:two-component system chemotaxis response regulator CheB
MAVRVLRAGNSISRIIVRADGAPQSPELPNKSQNAMNPPAIRILLADDAVTLRRIMGDVLATDPELKVCLAAKNGREAVTCYPELQPDVVLLDVEMPVMDGIEAAAAIRALDSRVPIIMFSTLTSNGAEATLDALTNGATDYIQKPTNCGHLTEVLGYLQRELIPKIKQWGRWFQGHRRRVARPVAESPGALRAATSESPAPRARPVIEMAAIGVSTGGPNALAELLKGIPAGFPVPILIVQHMPVMFTRLLAERLDQLCPLTVREAVEGTLVHQGDVWIAPGDYHMELQRVGRSLRLHMHQAPPENSCRPSVDVLFRSVASLYRDQALATILTGMGHDGRQGCHRIKELGGQVLAQDEASSVVWGMPGAVVKAGLADRVLPLNQIAAEMTRLTRRTSGVAEAAPMAAEGRAR